MSRLLLVEDDAVLLRAIVRCVRRHIPVVTATTATEALAILDGGDIAGILTDHDLGDKERTGAWLLAQAQVGHPHVRRILMTGNAQVTAHAIGGVAERIFIKPFPLDTIIALFATGGAFSRSA